MANECESPLSATRGMISTLLVELYSPVLQKLDAAPAQPCDTEFTTIGDAPFPKEGNIQQALNMAYVAAKTLAELLCKEPCPTAVFQSYEKIEIAFIDSIRVLRVTVKWKCPPGQD